MYINDGIRCNAIAPGGIKSEIAASMGIPNQNKSLWGGCAAAAPMAKIKTAAL